MKEVGDIVLYKGKKAVIINVKIPKCRCKGKGSYVLHLMDGNYRVEVPITTVFEKYKEDFNIKKNLTTHTF